MHIKVLKSSIKLEPQKAYKDDLLNDSELGNFKFVGNVEYKIGKYISGGGKYGI